MTPAGKLLAGFSYSDRIAPILDGSVTDERLHLTFELDSATRIFHRTLEGQEFDLAEMSLAAHCMAASRGDRRFVGLPIFTSRMFRHHSIYVWGDRFHLPQQLNGGRIGVSDYGSTTSVWLRGILSQYHGLDHRDLSWCIGPTDAASNGGSQSKPLSSQPIPPGIKQMQPSPNSSLIDMLERGELDAVICPHRPRSATSGTTSLRPLFHDPIAVEKSYLRTTGLFPIMHLCVLRSDKYQQDPALAKQIHQLFHAARQVAQERLKYTDTLVAMVPWLGYAADPTLDSFPAGGWAYGVKDNQHCLETFLGYLEDQELVATPINTNDIFAAEFLGG